jgi:hypothetical protein
MTDPLRQNEKVVGSVWEFFSNELACSMRGWEKDIVYSCKIDECAAKIQSSIIKACEMPPQNRFRGAEYSLLEL